MLHDGLAPGIRWGRVYELWHASQCRPNSLEQPFSVGSGTGPQWCREVTRPIGAQRTPSRGLVLAAGRVTLRGDTQPFRSAADAGSRAGHVVWAGMTRPPAADSWPLLIRLTGFVVVALREHAEVGEAAERSGCGAPLQSERCTRNGRVAAGFSRMARRISSAEGAALGDSPRHLRSQSSACLAAAGACPLTRDDDDDERFCLLLGTARPPCSRTSRSRPSEGDRDAA